MTKKASMEKDDKSSSLYRNTGYRKKCSLCPKKKRLMQRRSADHGKQHAVPPIVHEVLRSPGQPLDKESRAFFEPRFSHEFSKVRVHADSMAAESAKKVNAQAYTVGPEMIFASGQYNPHTDEGKRLLAHELVHVVQQEPVNGGGFSDIKLSLPSSAIEREAEATGNSILQKTGTQTSTPLTMLNSPLLQRLCTSASICSAPISGSAGSFGVSETAHEVAPRQRRRSMSPSRALQSGHAGDALQLEIFLEAQNPGFLANIQGIFIDWDMSPNTAAMVDNCADWMREGLPPGALPRRMVGATKPCMFVPAHLNQEAFAFNRTPTGTIAGQPREEWQVQTLQILTHEVEHVVFDTATHSPPPGITTTTCTRANIGGELSELAAILSEFPVAFRAIPSGADASHHARQRLNNWFTFAITNSGESIRGALQKMGCLCECNEVDAFVIDAFNFISAGWSQREKDALSAELRRPVWSIRWPINPSSSP